MLSNRQPSQESQSGKGCPHFSGVLQRVHKWSMNAEPHYNVNEVRVMQNTNSTGHR